MTKVISLALFQPLPGEHRHSDALDHFAHFLPAVLRAARCLFPDWEIWLHTDGCEESCYYGSTLKLLHQRGIIKLRHCGPVPALCAAMLWRLYPALDGAAEYVLCRDIDSLPMPRDRWAVEEWLEQGTCLHSIHDHQNHRPGDGLYLPGGLMGVRSSFMRAGNLSSMRTLLTEAHRMGLSMHVKGDDQVLLNALLPPLAKGSWLQHNVNPQTGRAFVMPRYLPDVPNEAQDKGNKMADYLGGVFSISPVCEWYNNFGETTLPIQECEWEAGETVPFDSSQPGAQVAP